AVPILAVPSETISFNEWNITVERSNILKSMCTQGANVCEKNSANCCELCTYKHALNLPHLPGLVFHKNKLMLENKYGAKMQFGPMDALKFVDNGKDEALEVACAQKWCDTRSELMKCKRFDWTFTSPYQGTLNEEFRAEPTDIPINKDKLLQREDILFFDDITLYEDELHDQGISKMSVRIRVMASGFLILLRHFLRVDDVLIRLHDTRFYWEIENDYILKEFVHREAPCSLLQDVISIWTNPDELQNYLPVAVRELHKLYF
ncbi:CG9578, partial [Drosophila busckii]